MFVPGAWFELRCLLHCIIVARLTRHFVRAKIAGVIVAICKLGIVCLLPLMDVHLRYSSIAATNILSISQ